MATEESPKLPPYSELILEAISSVGDEGASKAAISKHIEDAHSSLPDDHATLLAAELARMKEEGELVLSKNNYQIPASETPAKRGRGRPPKAKTPGGTPAAAASGDGSAKRGRGRPPKAGGAVTPAKVSSGKGRGRPPKVKDGEEAPAAKAAKSEEVASPASGSKKGRGRPPKAKAAADVAA